MLDLQIVTPEEKIFSDQVDSVLLPGSEGEMGVLPQHAPVVTALTPGELRYQQGDTEHELAVGHGFVEVTQGRVAVLTDMAVSEEQIDEAIVEEALKRAEDSLQGLTTDEEVALVEASIQKSLAQLHLKRKRRRQV